jgi:hypothetical protein
MNTVAKDLEHLASHPVEVHLEPATEGRNRLTSTSRLILAIPHLLIVCVPGVAWALSTLVAWFAILLTGRYPEPLYGFAVGVLRWHVRVEAYLLLLHDEYPPFSLE